MGRLRPGRVRPPSTDGRAGGPAFSKAWSELGGTCRSFQKERLGGQCQETAAVRLRFLVSSARGLEWRLRPARENVL
jgi:hypothetical protein